MSNLIYGEIKMAQSSYGSNSFNSKPKKISETNQKSRGKKPAVRSFQNHEITDLSQRDDVKIKGRFSNYDPFDMDEINSYLRERDFSIGRRYNND